MRYCAQAFEWVGMPEGQYHLAMATLYLATAPKSNSAGAYWKALAEVKEHDAGPVPIYLRDKADTFRGELREHYKQTLGEHQAYKYPHDYPEGWVEQRYLPEGVEAGWFRPKRRGYERDIIERLEKWKSETSNVKRKPSRFCALRFTHYSLIPHTLCHSYFVQVFQERLRVPAAGF